MKTYTTKSGLVRELPKQHYLTGSLDRLKQYYQGHFFDKDSMRFWNSRISESSITENIVDGQVVGAWFATSEDNFDRSKRLYTARYFDISEHYMSTIGEFQAYSSLRQAKSVIKSLAKI